MCASAGIPILPENTPESDDGEDMDVSESRQESLFDNQSSRIGQEGVENTSRFEENDDQRRVRSSGYPLK